MKDCSQCGLSYLERACGPTHAIRAHEIRTQRKLNNIGACSHLDAAIWFIRLASKLWPFRHVDGLIETLQQLKAKIRAELLATTSPKQRTTKRGTEI